MPVPITSYVGTYALEIDSNGGFNLPDLLRKVQNDNHFVLLKHPTYPIIVGGLSAMGSTSATLSEVFSQNFKNNNDCQIIMPSSFIEHLEWRADEKIAVVGMGNHFKILSENNWALLQPEYEKQFVDALAEQATFVPRRFEK